MKSLELAKPYLICVVGIPGSGKTTFASKFSTTFGSIFLNVKELMGYGLNTTNATRLAIKLFRDLAPTKQAIVFEGITGDQLERKELAKLAKSLGYEAVFVWLQIDNEIARTRALKKSRSNPFPLDERRFDVLASKFVLPNDKEKPVIISGMHTYATQARTVLKHLAANRENHAKQIANRPRQALAIPNSRQR